MYHGRNWNVSNFEICFTRNNSALYAISGYGSLCYDEILNTHVVTFTDRDELDQYQDYMD